MTSSNKQYPSAHFALWALRAGDMEPVSQHIEMGGGDMLFMMMTPEDRERLARAIRTGSPLTRREKRENREACRVRDIILITRLFYWIGQGAPGFSHTAENTAFHYALQDYAEDVLPGAPVRTAESLYRHVWKPYVKRFELLEPTKDDLCGHMKSKYQRTHLSSFIYGIITSKQTTKEVLAKIEWFEKTFLKQGIRFYINDYEALALRRILHILDIPVERWREHLVDSYFGSVTRILEYFDPSGQETAI
tara:strand:- start:504 stop:1250 length:747 start_codon:yes stop_codon:yes gene_type:complete